MTEKERADFYQAHKDDPELWGDAEPQEAPRKRLSATITVRLTPDEAEALSLRAQASGQSYGELVRQVLREYLYPKNVLIGREFTMDYHQPPKTGTGPVTVVWSQNT